MTTVESNSNRIATNHCFINVDDNVGAAANVMLVTDSAVFVHLHQQWTDLSLELKNKDISRLQVQFGRETWLFGRSDS